MSSRITYVDNAKMFLLFLVVVGHFLSYQGVLLSNRHLLGLCNCIYAFHMPLFVIISGYLSRNITYQRQKDISTLLYPYLIFQIFTVLYIKYVERGTTTWNLFIPYHQNWYILALFIWRLIIPYFKYVKQSIGISVSILLSVVFSKYHIQDNIFALPYVFVFLPFYVIGYYAGNIINKIEDSALNVKLSICVITGCFVIVYGISAFTEYGVGLLKALKPPYNCVTYADFIVRYASFTISLIISLSVMVIVKGLTNRTNGRDFSGGGTILIYLMHFFIVIPLWRILPQYHYAMSLLISITASVIICWLFSRHMVIKLFKPLLDMNYLIDVIKNVTQRKNNI